MNTGEIIFSPTGGTEKVAHIIRRQWSESTIKIDLSDSATMCSFLDNFCINVPDNIDDVNIQEKPLYKVDHNTYCFLYIKFFRTHTKHYRVFIGIKK